MVTLDFKWNGNTNEMNFLFLMTSEKIKNWTQFSVMLLVSNLTNMDKEKVSKQDGEQTSQS